jgi:UDPglucose 6-dehydrogenase
MNIGVVGTGYVGLVTGTCLAETGNDVICVDIDEKKVEMMRNGEVPIYEPGLKIMFERNIKAGRLHFTTSLQEAADHASIIFLALPTPPGEDGSADLSYILAVANELGKMITEYKVIVDKSTVPVGTSEKVFAQIKQHTNIPFDVVSNPEFLREGFAVDDFMKPDRIVIGAESDRAIVLMEALYKPYVRSGNPIISMDLKSAELTKYAANAFLATKITFMNEIANFCEIVGADVDMIRRGIGADNRIGKRFLFPGIGYGGSCFPKDVQALRKSGQEYGYPFRVLDAVEEVNHAQKISIVPKIVKYFNGSLKGVKLALWGLAFKPDTDDIREAPALYIIAELLKAGAEIRAYDPEAMENVKVLLGDKVDFYNDSYDALDGADALVIATEWAQFRTPNFNKISEKLKNKTIFDGRNLYDLTEMEELGYYYESVGRRIVK